GGRVPSPDERVEAVDLGQTGEVAGRAVEDDTVARPGENGVTEIVTDECAFVDLPEAVGDVDITGLQRVDGPGVHRPNTTFLRAAVEDPRGQIGSCGQVLGRERAAHHGDVSVNGLPVALELGVEAVRAQNPPRLFDGDLPHTSQDVIGDPGTAIGEP